MDYYDLEQIRVAIVANTMGVPVAYAQSKGFYEEEGIDIDPIVFPSGPQVNEGTQLTAQY